MSNASKMLAELIEERDRLKALNAELVMAIEHTLAEVGWFISHKKDLDSLVGNETYTWAEVLDRDLDVARAVLAKAEKA